MMTDKKISVVIPCRNEELNILPMYERLTKVFSEITPNYELIYTDNSSTDNSEKIFRDLSSRDDKVKVILFSRNFGTSDHGYSAGTDLASGDAVVWIDGDIQDPPEMIKEFVAKWLAGDDVIYGIRKKRRGSLFLRAGYKIFYRIFKKLSYLEIPQDAGDFCLMDRKVANVINSMPERDRFVRGLRTWVGFKQTGIEYVRSDRNAGKTKVNFWRLIWSAKKGIFSFSYAPLEMISNLAFIVTILAGFGIVFYILLYLFYPVKAQGVATIIVITLFLGSIQLMALSIIGEYLGRIFEEVKQRPKYVIKEILNDPRKN